MKNKLTIPIPKSISSEQTLLFKGREKYTISPLKEKHLKNVFISHEGLCLKNGLLVSGSHYNLWGKEDATFYWPFWKLAMEQFLVSTYGKSLKKQHLDDGLYLHIGTKWFGYFFWITSVLPRLIRTQKWHKEASLLFPEDWASIPYVESTLELFPDLKKKVIPKGVHMQVENLLLPEVRQWSNAIDPAMVKLTQNFVFNQLDKKNITLNLGEKVYISRRKAARRKPINEKEVESALKHNGFALAIMEDYSLMEQISIMRHAKEVIGLHGAGLANIQFMQEGGRVIELSPVIENPKDFRIPFWRLAHACRLQYEILFCPISNMPTSGDIYEADLNININVLLQEAFF